MEDFAKLPWSWYTLRSPEEQLHYFDQSFSDDEHDVLYCLLNDIDSDVTMSSLSDSFFEDELHPKDPRTQQPVADLELDFTNLSKKPKKTDIHPNFPKKSQLSKKQHAICLRVLKSMRGECKSQPSDHEVFQGSMELRKKEYALYIEFVRNYSASIFNIRSELIRCLTGCYEKKLKREIDMLLRNDDEFFILQSGLQPLEPMVGVSVPPNFLGKPEIVYKTGLVPMYPDITDIPRIIRRDDIEIPVIAAKESVDENLFAEHSIEIVLPEATLQVIIETMNDPSEVWEIPLTVEFDEDTNQKTVIFAEPLPIRNLNIARCNRALEELCEAKIRHSAATEWYCLQKDIFLNDNEKSNNDLNLHAVDLQREYQVIEFEDYLKQLKNNSHIEMNSQKNEKSNSVAVKWSLCSKDTPINILTETKYNFVKSKDEKLSFINTSIKLEHKIKFGAEIMSRNELLNEWLLVHLKADSVVERKRIDVQSMDIIVEQTLTKAAIENEMLRLYNIRPSDFLLPLSNLLTLVKTFPDAKYLLQRTMKHAGKILVFMESKEITPNGISYHQLYKDFSFSENLLRPIEFIPLDSEVILPMHEHHQIIPCCFPYWGINNKTLFDDRQQILKRVEAVRKKRDEKKLAAKKAFRKKNKKLRKKQKNAVNQNLVDADNIGATSTAIVEEREKTPPPSFYIPPPSTVTKIPTSPYTLRSAEKSPSVGRPTTISRSAKTAPQVKNKFAATLRRLKTLRSGKKVAKK